MNYILLLSCALLVVCAEEKNQEASELLRHREKKPIFLHAMLFDQLDGCQEGERVIKKIHVFKLRILEMLAGKKDRATGTRTGIFSFKGHHVTVIDLAELEAQAVDNPKLKEQLSAMLSKVIDYFEEISDPHLKEANEMKSSTVLALQKWSEERDLGGCYLLEWHKLQPGTERIEFRKRVTTFKSLVEFLDDLKLFLGDFIQSCPKSWKKYKETVS